MVQILIKRSAYGWNIVYQSKKYISSLSKTLKYISDNFLEVMFPNIKKVMSILLTTSATSASIERANSAVRFIKTDYRSTMSEDHLNALVFLYVHWDVKLDYNRIIQKSANKYPCRVLLIKLLLKSWKSLIHKGRTLWFVFSFIFIIFHSTC